MRKMRDDSTWNKLTSEQRETLEIWLFDENLGYAKTLERVQKEFGIEATIASVGRFYRRRARERQVEELVEAQAAASELNDLPVSVASLREAAVKLVGKAALKLVGEKPQDLEHLVSFTKLLLESENNDLRKSRLKLAQQYFDYEATAASLTELPQLRAYLKVVGDDSSLNHDEKIKRVQAILFGWDRSKSGVNGQDTATNGN
jgi:histidyl-tRNA synthetase